MTHMKAHHMKIKKEEMSIISEALLTEMSKLTGNC